MLFPPLPPYNPANVRIRGGSINGTPIGTVTPAAGSFTTITATGLVDISAAGAGQIKFPATQNPSANANTLDDYEEGTWTPIDSSGAGLSLVGASGTYRKIGGFVWVSGALSYPATASGVQATVGGLPFTPAAGNENRTGVLSYTTAATPNKWLLDGAATSGSFFAAAGGGITNANMSGSFDAINAGYVV